MKYLFEIAVLAFLTGIASVLFLSLPLTYLYLLGVIAVGMFIIGRRRSGAPSAPFLILFATLIICFSLGFLRMHTAEENFHSSSLTEKLGTEIAFEGVVVREPDIKAKSTHLYVKVDDEIILVTSDRYVLIAYGDVIEIRGELTKPKTFVTELGRQFDYPGYLKARGVQYIVQYAEVERIREGEGNGIITALLRSKHILMNGIESVIPEPQAGLGEGLLLGVKQALGEELETAFRKAGIIHIVVLSGYNIMLIVAFVMYALSHLLSPKWRMVVGIIAITAFALMVGLSATVVRASIMAGLLLIAGAIGRVYQILRALLLAGVIMVALNPYLLMYDIGFQLSFMATLGLILIMPIIDRLFLGRFSLPGKEYLGATIATQIAVLPLLLYHMGEVSVVAVLVNLLVLPAVPIAMLGTFLSGLISLASPIVALPVAFLTNLVLSYIVILAVWFSGLPFAAVSIVSFPWWGAVLLYLFITGGLWWYYHRPEKNEYADWVIEEENETGGARSAPPAETPVFFR